MTRCLRAMKCRVAALDLAYDASYRKRSTKRGKKPAKGQLFDLLSPSGFAMAIMSCLACVQDNHVIVIAVVCSSFVSISRGSTGRSYLNPLGFPDCDATKIGNLLASRLETLESGYQFSSQRWARGRVTFHCQVWTAEKPCLEASFASLLDSISRRCLGSRATIQQPSVSTPTPPRSVPTHEGNWQHSVVSFARVDGHT